MADPKPASPPQQPPPQQPVTPQDQQARSKLEYNLVLIMLATLTILIFLVLVMPLQDTKPCTTEQERAGGSALNANAGQAVSADNSNQRPAAAASPSATATATATATPAATATPTPDANAAGMAALAERLDNMTRNSQRADCLQYSLSILDRRKDFLAILLTAFGAWVGAGAAYFFGRENLRVAANSLLQMQRASSTERLRATTIAEVPPKPLDWLVKKSQTVGEVYDKLKEEAERWFITVVHEDSGALLTVIEEEALYRYIIDEAAAAGAEGTEAEAEEAEEGEDELESPPASPASPRERTIEQVIEHINTKEEFERYRRVFVRVKMETSVETANEQMDRQGIYLAIVIGEKDKPTHFITTSEVRKLLLKTD